MATVVDNYCNISQLKSNKVASKVEVCPMRNENHDIQDCTYYLQKTMEEKNKYPIQEQTMLLMSENSEEGTYCKEFR